MNYVSWDIALVVLLPALLLCGFIYCKDKIEKEPIGLLALLFALGAAVCIPTVMLERAISGGIDRLFSDHIVFGVDGAAVYSSELAYALHSFLVSFFAIAAVEVCIKWCILYFVTRNNKHFNYLFDGIVYSVFISLGFAACENLRFAWVNGWDTIVLKALSSIPSHLFVGILMGYYFSRWHVHREAREAEIRFLELGIIEKRVFGRPWKRLLLSFVLPMGICGGFLFVLSIDSVIVKTLFYFVIFTLYGLSFVSVDRIASRDTSSKKFSERLLCDKHPELEGAPIDRIIAESDKG